ncbi:MAG: YncE family protein, partial [Actinomadura sp.]
MRRTKKATFGAALVTAVAATALGIPSVVDAGEGEQTRQVLFVGNNWDGTVDVVSADGRLDKLGKINIVPDLAERMREITLNPVRLIYFNAVKLLIGEGHDQLVDDMYTTPDGALLIVSRPSLADVVGIDIATGEIAWRFPVEGQRADHMALSPDGRQVAVSASTANKVHLLDVQTGRQVGSFATGDSPHENVYTADGKYIVNASIGLVYTPLDRPLLDSTKGKRYFQIVDRATGATVRQLDMGRKLAEAGYE